MDITVFGATGTVGRLLVDQALAAGHHVVAHTRDASRVPRRHERLRVVAGDPTRPADCRRAVAGADAVVICVGAGRHGEVREATTRAVVAAMHDEGVRRLVCQSTIGVGDSRANLDLWWRYVMFGLLLRPAFPDHVRQEQVVAGSGLDWTVVRPSALVDDGAGTPRVAFGPDEPGLTLKVDRADVAALLLEQVQGAADLESAVAVSA